MASPNSVDAILAGAKATLDKANKFSATMPAMVPPASDIKQTPYKAATQARKKSYGIADEAKDAGEGIKANIENAKQVSEAK
jgi:hypothetical protein